VLYAPLSKVEAPPSFPPEPAPAPPFEELAFPRFPWPPPQASARLVLPSHFFSDDVYLKDVADRLIAAFDGQRYEYSFRFCSTRFCPRQPNRTY
jgi:hypothetical protein